MVKIISINAGSSSLKFQLFEMDTEEVIASGVMERIKFEDSIFSITYNKEKTVQTIPLKDHQVAVQLLLDTLLEKKIVSSLEEIKGVGHRIVQGGSYFKQSVKITPQVANTIQGLSALAPLHNPANLEGYFAFKKAIPSADAVAVFDTAFHQTLAKEKYIYPLPLTYYQENNIRKYGAHGTSHQYVSQEVIKALGEPQHSKVIVCHLGNGASISAIKDGECIDTSMGFTPLAGVMMGTRSGDVDPSIMPYLCKQLQMSSDDVLHMYNNESGLLGISGISSDFRDVQEAAFAGNENAKLALSIYFQRIISYIGNYHITLGGLDAIAFTAGIGENSAYARKEILDLLAEALGIVIDEEANKNGKEKGLISTPTSNVKVYVIPTDEELMIARDTKKILQL